jgi:hypothetical protein
MSGFDVPVAFLIFNRPEVTARVFQAIRAARPRQLLVVADGPRPDRDGEAERCARARAVLERVDWPCQVLRTFSDVNLGCGRRISSGLDWVFDTVERALVFEDDCLPSPSFFPYARELLARHALDERVMEVTGANLLGSWRPRRASYHFVHVGHVWGWATWRRAWRHYDFAMRAWGDPEVRARVSALFREMGDSGRCIDHYDATFAGKVDTWDFQWQFARLQRGGLCALPSVNLITNIGFGPEATHTIAASRFADLPRGELHFPLRPPREVGSDLGYDRRLLRAERTRPFTARRLVPKPLRRFLPPPKPRA